MREWRAGLLEAGVSSTMVAKPYRLLRAILNTAVTEDELIIVNLPGSKAPGRNKRGHRPPSSIRTATVADAGDVARLLRQLHPEEAERSTLPLVRQQSQTFVALDEAIVGVAVATFVDYGFAAYGTVEELVVDADHRGDGVGGRFLIVAGLYTTAKHGHYCNPSAEIGHAVTAGIRRDGTLASRGRRVDGQDRV